MIVYDGLVIRLSYARCLNAERQYYAVNAVSYLMIP